MRHALSRLLSLGLPALLLAVVVVVWSGGAQADGGAHHPDGTHAVPCHEQQVDSAAPAHDPGTADRQCPDCRCLFTGCNAQALTGPPP